MGYNFLPDEINKCIQKLPLDKLYEIRLRLLSPIMVNISGKNYYLTESGFSDESNYTIFGKQSHIEYILQKISNNALYTILDQLINGFVTIDGGIRIGVTGDIVTVNNQIKTIKNITSLNIRIPHEVKNCSLNCYLYLVNGGSIFNTLVVSPAGAGKTTFIRDFASQLIKRDKRKNILIVDERCEITGGTENKFLLGADVYLNCKKNYAFENGIRSMKPDIIITDELNPNTDIEAVENAITSGVKVVATMHANNINDLKNKKYFLNILDKKMFDRIVVLSSSNGAGTIEGVYNEELSCIYA